ncbi:MAG: AAA family ATPase [Clostridia bacterium]|nr:AAA family ATPase [Clostridia bacterium]
MLIIVSGSAGVGKNTVITEILNKYPNIKLMQTCTTRQPRHTDEAMHSPYIYVTREDFESKIKNGELFEHEEIHQNLYGVLNASLDEIAMQQNHYIKDIGVLGQINLKRALKDKVEVVSIFLTAPKEELIKRLKARGDHDIDLRISRMEFELSYTKNYDYVIENINLEKTLKKIETLIKKHEKIEQKRFKKA